MKTLQLMSYLKKTEFFPLNIRNKAKILLTLCLFHNVVAKEMRKKTNSSKRKK